MRRPPWTSSHGFASPFLMSTEDIVAELTDHAKAIYESASSIGDDADEAERRVEDTDPGVGR